MSEKEQPEGAGLAADFAARRGRVYPAHQWLAERFPDYVRIMLELDEEIRRRPRATTSACMSSSTSSPLP